MFKKASNPGAWPTELKFIEKKASLKVSFDDGFSGDIPYELLRVESPSAETKGHGGENPPPPAGKRHVAVTNASPVGRYAVRISFTDGHDTGLYTWPYLYDLAKDKSARMKSYQERLKDAGLSRD